MSLRVQTREFRNAAAMLVAAVVVSGAWSADAIRIRREDLLDPAGRWARDTGEDKP